MITIPVTVIHQLIVENKLKKKDVLLIQTIAEHGPIFERDLYLLMSYDNPSTVNRSCHDLEESGLIEKDDTCRWQLSPFIEQTFNPKNEKKENNELANLQYKQTNDEFSPDFSSFNLLNLMEARRAAIGTVAKEEFHELATFAAEIVHVKDLPGAVDEIEYYLTQNYSETGMSREIVYEAATYTTNQLVNRDPGKAEIFATIRFFLGTLRNKFVTWYSRAIALISTAGEVVSDVMDEVSESFQHAKEELKQAFAQAAVTAKTLVSPGKKKIDVTLDTIRTIVQSKEAILAKNWDRYIKETLHYLIVENQTDTQQIVAAVDHADVEKIIKLASYPRNLVDLVNQYRLTFQSVTRFRSEVGRTAVKSEYLEQLRKAGI